MTTHYFTRTKNGAKQLASVTLPSDYNAKSTDEQKETLKQQVKNIQKINVLPNTSTSKNTHNVEELLNDIKPNIDKRFNELYPVVEPVVENKIKKGNSYFNITQTGNKKEASKLTSDPSNTSVYKNYESVAQDVKDAVNTEEKRIKAEAAAKNLASKAASGNPPVTPPATGTVPTPGPSGSNTTKCDGTSVSVTANNMEYAVCVSNGIQIQTGGKRRTRHKKQRTLRKQKRSTRTKRKQNKRK